ncbi:MAG TPA: hypothetical protein VJ438_00180 [Candidatus Nanoarchaeia archaeon]|nr:hypothetical protein [Candidatus Nanoarchaeia archaeon]
MNYEKFSGFPNEDPGWEEEDSELTEDEIQDRINDNRISDYESREYDNELRNGG